jgi:hypothetical protein
MAYWANALRLKMVASSARLGRLHWRCWWRGAPRFFFGHPTPAPCGVEQDGAVGLGNTVSSQPLAFLGASNIRGNRHGEPPSRWSMEKKAMRRALRIKLASGTGRSAFSEIANGAIPWLARFLSAAPQGSEGSRGRLRVGLPQAPARSHLPQQPGDLLGVQRS